MDIEKLTEEIQNLQEELAKTSPTDKEYDELLERLKGLHDMLIKEQDANLRAFDQSERIRIEELKAENMLVVEEAKAKNAKRDSKNGVIKSILGGAATIFVGLIAVHAEGTRAITSKVWNLIPKAKL